MQHNASRTATRFALAPLCLLLASAAANATDGYFANGYGMKSVGMGGAAAAVAMEPFGGAVNPGAMTFLDSQWQLGASWFSPDRSASRTGSGPWGIDGSATSDSTNFFIPEFAINWRYRPDVALGVSVFGNGATILRPPRSMATTLTPNFSRRVLSASDFPVRNELSGTRARNRFCPSE